MHQARNRLLHILIQDHIIPIGLLNFIIQQPTHLPVPIVHIHILVIRPRADCSNQIVRHAIAGHDRLALGRLFQDVLQLLVPHRDNVDDEVLHAPFVIVFGEGASLDQLVGDTAAGITSVEVAVALDGFVDDVEFGGGIASSSELE